MEIIPFCQSFIKERKRSMRAFLKIFLATAIFIISCADNTTDPVEELENKLYLLIENSDGDVLEDVNLHFFCNSWLGESSQGKQSSSPQKTIGSGNRLSQNFPNPFMPSTIIEFYISDSCHVLLRVLDRMDSTEIVRTLKNEDLGPGLYQVSWDGTNHAGEHVANDIYNYEIIAGDLWETKNLFVDVIHSDLLISLNSIPLSTSDMEGKIEVDYVQFPIGIETRYTDPNGTDLGTIVIPDSLSLIFLKDGYLPLTKVVTIIEDEPLEISVVLDRE